MACEVPLWSTVLARGTARAAARVDAELVVLLLYMFGEFYFALVLVFYSLAGVVISRQRSTAERAFWVNFFQKGSGLHSLRPVGV